MSDDPFESWTTAFVPPSIQPPPVSSSVIAEYLRSLETPKTGSLSALPSSTATAPASTVERSILEKIAEATKKVRKAISDGKLDRNAQHEWTSRLLLFLRPVYGKRSALITTLEKWRVEVSKAQLSQPEFIARIEQIEHCLLPLNVSAASGSFVDVSRQSLVPATKNVFIIHGRDETNQLRLSRSIRDDFGLVPIVLLDKPGRSAPTIEKFERHAETCCYAIALFTADDKVTAKNGEVYWQPRPNVIFETGWFVGRLGKEHVLILLQEGVRIYSDFDGVNRIQFRDDIDDKFRQIRAELAASGLAKATD